MNVVALPAFADNYIWMLHDQTHAVVVDPGDAAVVERALDERGLVLQAILVTHHHPDHTGGVDALRVRLRGPVYGPARERIPEPFEPVRDGDVVDVLGLAAEVLEVPGHTAGHVAYGLRSAPGAPWLFCGDTLFSAGCGRLFEGTPQQMHGSLSRLAAWPADTHVYCTHEYTLSNLRFARAVEPDNPDIVQAQQAAEQQRRQRLATLPSTIGHERRINPFLRCTEAAVVATARAQGASDTSPVAVFAALRSWKNRFA